MKRLRLWFACSWLVVSAVSAPTRGQAPPPARVELTVPNAVLVDHAGKSVRLVEDVLAGKTVAVNFIFTTCTTICPPMGANFAQLGKLLRERRDPSKLLVSISVDPLNDTPERLRAWRDAFGISEGWTLLTGDRQTVIQVLKAMGAFTSNKLDHAPVALIGNFETKSWQRIYGLTPPAEILRMLDQISSTTPKRENRP